MNVSPDSGVGTADELLLAEDQQRGLSVQEVINSCHVSLITFLRARLRVQEDAYDIAQEAYIRMMKYEGAKNIRSAPSMLFRIATNVVNDQGRASLSHRAGDHVSIDDYELASEEPSMERILSAQQRLDLICDAIDKLPRKCRQVFVLSRVSGLTYPQIAERCGISVKTVEKHISHALSVCRLSGQGRV
jgi:RNA polymerase sigma-70 factor (ECF subfamily)